jgi:hypothetical protein
VPARRSRQQFLRTGMLGAANNAAVGFSSTITSRCITAMRSQF